MNTLSDNLLSFCNKNPEKKIRVIVTLLEKYQNFDISKLEMDEYSKIPGIQGIYSAELTGKKIIELSKNRKIENISKDSIVTII